MVADLSRTVQCRRVEPWEVRKVWARRSLSLGVGLVLTVATAVRGEPEVRVYARTRIALEAARDARGFQLQGSLRDDADAGLGGRALVLEISAADVGSEVHSTALRSAADGRFAAAVELKRGAYRVRVRFAGDAHYAASEGELPIDLTRAEVRLRFIEPATATLDLERAPHAIFLRASSPLGGAGLSVDIEDERGRKVAQGTTAEDAARWMRPARPC